MFRNSTENVKITPYNLDRITEVYDESSIQGWRDVCLSVLVADSRTCSDSIGVGWAVRTLP